MLSIGAEEEINRDRPKSVSLRRGVGKRSSGIDPLSVRGNVNGLIVSMISSDQRSYESIDSLSSLISR